MTMMEANREKAERSAAQISEKKQDIKYDTRDYVIGYLVERFLADEFYIPDEYQRNFIWDDKTKCNFIESILMGLPIPFMFFADTDDGRIEIVDGAQRTQTITQFVSNELVLTDLGILDESNGLSFEQLDPSVQRRFKNANVRVVFLEEGTTEEVRQEIFKRINTGGENLKPPEIRRGSYSGDFYKFLEECAKNELFCQLAPRTERTEKRFEGVELVTRFFAYYDNYGNGFEGYTGNVTGYIDEYVKCMNERFQNNVEMKDQYKEVFETMLNSCEILLGSKGFRKTANSKSTPRARFEALAIGMALALKETPGLCVEESPEWLESEEFLNCTRSDAANNKGKLKGRIDFVKNNLLGE